jgi:hypothetical protein
MLLSPLAHYSKGDCLDGASNRNMLKMYRLSDGIESRHFQNVNKEATKRWSQLLRETRTEPFSKSASAFGSHNTVKGHENPKIPYSM